MNKKFLKMGQVSNNLFNNLISSEESKLKWTGVGQSFANPFPVLGQLPTFSAIRQKVKEKIAFWSQHRC